ncbi:MAG: hypothetical protein IMY83_00445, partial [Chloroflexi bacterium]|nr:hypothetical protein [Chloroflexota bacterium]
MLGEKLTRCLQQAMAAAQQDGSLALVALPDATVEHPQDPAHGDFASGLPLKLARTVGMSPLTIAEKIVEHISPPAEVGK